MHVRWKAKQLRLNRAAKLGRDVTQDEVAKATGLAISRLSDIENNKAEGVRFDTLTRLAKFYGVKQIGELLEFAEENSNPILVAC
ncbi:helix-turn-helix transcriptional regulator [Candidatus Gracilibacteria bacterium]|nr:helix-turn-helix transcriptional regulator [Candidatus Gracilibacteria bacterium]